MARCADGAHTVVDGSTRFRPGPEEEERGAHVSEFREGQIRKEVSQGIVDGVLKLIGILMLFWIGTIVLLVLFASMTAHWWVVIPLVVGAAMIVVGLARTRRPTRS